MGSRPAQRRQGSSALDGVGMPERERVQVTGTRGRRPLTGAGRARLPRQTPWAEGSSRRSRSRRVRPLEQRAWLSWSETTPGIVACGHDSAWTVRWRRCHPPGRAPVREHPARFRGGEGSRRGGAPRTCWAASSASPQSRWSTGWPSAPAAWRCDAWVCAAAAETGGTTASAIVSWRGAPERHVTQA